MKTQRKKSKQTAIKLYTKSELLLLPVSKYEYLYSEDNQKRCNVL